MSDDPPVTLHDSVRPRPSRAGLACGVSALALVLALAGCGTIPSQPSAGSTVPTSTTPAATGTPTSAATGVSASLSPSPSGAPSSTTTRPAPTKAAPKKAAPTPPPDSWVGHFQGKTVYVPHGHGARLSFTFDDGPWPGSTSQVLALLEQHHVHAVFCLIGNQAKVNPTLVHREVAGGHELCDHSRDHDLFMAKHKQAYVDAEVGDGLADIARVAPHGTRIRFYRQPGGTWSPAVVKAMGKYHLDPLRWSDDPRDWSRPGSAAIVRRVVSHLHPGVVILMHDGGGDRSQSVAALRFLLDAVIKAGWKPVLAPHVQISAKEAATPQ